MSPAFIPMTNHWVFLYSVTRGGVRRGWRERREGGREEVSRGGQCFIPRQEYVLGCCCCSVKASSVLLSQALSGGYTDHLLFHFPWPDHSPSHQGWGFVEEGHRAAQFSVKMDLSATTWKCVLWLVMIPHWVSVTTCCFEMSLQET